MGYVIDVNLKGTYYCSRALLPVMRSARWCRIVNFSSTAGKVHSAIGGAHYTATKVGVLGFPRHLAKEKAVFGITVNLGYPGLFQTEMATSTISDRQAISFARSFPIPRLGC